MKLRIIRIRINRVRPVSRNKPNIVQKFFVYVQLHQIYPYKRLILGEMDLILLACFCTGALVVTANDKRSKVSSQL